MKTLPSGLAHIGAIRLLGCGLRDSLKRWLDTVGDVI